MSGAGLRALLDRWAAQGETLRGFGADAQAGTLERCAGELGTVLDASDREPLTVDAAAAESGYSPSQLRRLLSAGTIANVGAAGEVRIRRGDLPQKPGQLAARDRAAEAGRRLRAS